MTELAQIVAGWPVVLSMAAAVAAQSLRAGRRRSALNEALHELRRPLQAVALAAGPQLGGRDGAGEPIELAAAALERLDREINGGSLVPALGTVDVDGAALARSAVARWQARVQVAEGSLELRWSAGEARISGDHSALAQALDNLIVNAIEHGGPTIVVAGRLLEGRLRIAVVDSGRATRPRSRRNSPAQVIARLSGRHHRGHGLGVVRRVAADHDGRFSLRHSERGSLAVLELPLAETETGRAA
jgi:signal transduction histidine kinase